MKLFKSLKFFLTGLIFLLTSSMAAGASAQETFYENASFGKVEKFVAQSVQSKKQAGAKSDTKTQDHLNNISNVFLTAVFAKHPNYVKAVYKKFSQYSEEEKLMFATALAVIEGKEGLNTLPYSLPAEKNLLSIKDVDQTDLKNTRGMIALCSSTDYLWSAFEATGDDKYLKNILNYLASEPIIIRKFAFEMINRAMLNKVISKFSGSQNSKKINNDDIIQKITELSKKDKRYSLEKLIAYHTILWSMQAQRMQHPDIEAKVQRILKRQPDLNYSKDVRL
jgi:hypothetical protein